MTLIYKYKKYTISTLDELTSFLIEYNQIKNLKTLKNINISLNEFESPISMKKLLVEIKQKFQATTNRQIIYWFERGHSKEESTHIVYDLQSKHGKLGGKALPNEKRNTKIEFYTSKGYNITEARQMLKDRQQTFTKDKLVKKYGYNKGLEIFEDRQQRWLETIASNHDYDELISKKIMWMQDKNKVKKSQQKRKNTHIEKGLWTPLELLEDFEYYKREVWKVTNSNLHKIKGIETRSPNMHVDHKFSIKKGFEMHILPIIIGSPRNLEMLPRSINCSKKANCSVSLNELIIS